MVALHNLKTNLIQKFHETSADFDPTHERSQRAQGESMIRLSEFDDIMKKYNNDLYQKFEAKITAEVNELKTYFDSALENKFRQVMTYVDQEVGTLSERINGIEQRIVNMEEKQAKAQEYDPETTIVAENLQHEKDENLKNKMEKLIRTDLAVNVPIVRVTRLPEGPPRMTRFGMVRKPGIVKVQFESVEDKVKVLREKRNITNSPEFSNVFLRSSKSHSERIMQQNFKTLIEALPLAKDYMITGNGRLVKKENDPQNWNRFTRPQQLGQPTISSPPSRNPDNPDLSLPRPWSQTT